MGRGIAYSRPRPPGVGDGACRRMVVSGQTKPGLHSIARGTRASSHLARVALIGRWRALMGCSQSPSPWWANGRCLGTQRQRGLTARECPCIRATTSAYWQISEVGGQRPRLRRRTQASRLPRVARIAHPWARRAPWPPRNARPSRDGSARTSRRAAFARPTYAEPCASPALPPRAGVAWSAPFRRLERPSGAEWRARDLQPNK